MARYAALYNAIKAQPPAAQLIQLPLRILKSDLEGPRRRYTPLPPPPCHPRHSSGSVNSCQLYSSVIGFILNHHPHISSSAGYVQCVSFPLLDPLGAVPPLPGHWAQQACGLPMFAMNPATHNTRTDKNLSIEIL